MFWFLHRLFLQIILVISTLRVEILEEIEMYINSMLQKKKNTDDFLFISSLVQFVQFELETFLGRNGFQVNAKIMETKFI